MNKFFEKMGADVVVIERPLRGPLMANPRFRLPAAAGLQVARPRTAIPGLRVDVQRGTFRIDTIPGTTLQVIDAKPKDRHLLLMAKFKAGHLSTIQKFLCGHDERDWFVASVGNVTNVDQAKDSLRPAEVSAELLKAGVPVRKRHKRHNKAYIRQGEWFFVPAPDVVPSPLLILKNEPLRRADNRGGKPHVIEELYRQGGTTVYVSPKAPQGITVAEFNLLSQTEKKSTLWRMMTRNPLAYARGAIRHPDHSTVHLNGWHRIHMNGELRTESLGFLD